eukprot:3328133-Pyramimonas_sp.AAC.1
MAKCGHCASLCHLAPAAGADPPPPGGDPASKGAEICGLFGFLVDYFATQPWICPGYQTPLGTPHGA